MSVGGRPTGSRGLSHKFFKGYIGRFSINFIQDVTILSQKMLDFSRKKKMKLNSVFP